jgi:hypothetical protein
MAGVFLVLTALKDQLQHLMFFGKYDPVFGHTATFVSGALRQ